MEVKVGRPLLPTETVHHIDCNPLNNAIENLWLFQNESLHQLAHSSLETILEDLLKSGAVIFADGAYQSGPLTNSALGVAITSQAGNP